jgi:hypothetical protein
MSISDDYVVVAERFGAVARKYCDIVDSSSTSDRSDLLAQIYEVLPTLIDAAIHLPDAGTLVVDAEDEEDENSRDANPTPSPDGGAWDELHRSLKKRLGDTDTYLTVFDAATDKEAIHGSLSDDIAEIYRDLKDDLVLMDRNAAAPQNALWEWRYGFDSHWGHHAMSALKTIHDIRYY